MTRLQDLTAKLLVEPEKRLPASRGKLENYQGCGSGSAFIFPPTCGSGSRKNRKIIKVILKKLHGFLHFGKLYCVFQPQKTLHKVIFTSFLQLDPDPH